MILVPIMRETRLPVRITFYLSLVVSFRQYNRISFACSHVDLSYSHVPECHDNEMIEFVHPNFFICQRLANEIVLAAVVEIAPFIYLVHLTTRVLPFWGIVFVSS